MRAGILDGFQTIIPTAAAVLLKKRQMLRLTQQEIADRAKITLRQYQRLESGERSILTCSFGLACRVIGGFVIFMIPQVVGSVIVLLELAAVMLRQAWYI